RTESGAAGCLHQPRAPYPQSGRLLVRGGDREAGERRRLSSRRSTQNSGARVAQVAPGAPCLRRVVEVRNSADNPATADCRPPSRSPGRCRPSSSRVRRARDRLCRGVRRDRHAQCEQYGGCSAAFTFGSVIHVLLYACAGCHCSKGEYSMRNPVAALALAAVQCLLPGSGFAQVYPSKPVRLIVGFPAGGPADIFGRTFAQALSAGLGQTVIVENKSGVGGVLGIDAVAKASPDGYTLGFNNQGSVAMAPFALSKM